MKSLLAFTSGYDSLYVAWKWLTETNNDLTLLFLDMSLMRWRENVEYYVMPKHMICAERGHKYLCETYRQCNFERYLVRRFPAIKNLDHPRYFVRLAAKWVEEGKYDEVLHGLTGFYGTQSYALEKEFRQHTSKGSIRFPLRERHKSTVHQMAEMPEELQKYAVSCNGVATDDLGNFIDCGECHKCHRNDYFRNALKEGVDPDVACDAYNETDYKKHVNANMPGNRTGSSQRIINSS